MALQTFIKMHALGNDFVVFDARTSPITLGNKQLRHLANRHTGVGCDQVIILEPSEKADLVMRIFNADGGEVGACGNAARCVGLFLMEEQDTSEILIETQSALLQCRSTTSGLISIDMGKPRLDWHDIPLARQEDTLHLGIAAGPLEDAVAVNMGNPHAVFLVPDCSSVDLRRLGPILETNAVFPERANISVAEVIDSENIRLRVWERGTGITLACGTAACATLVAANRRGVCERQANIVLDGGVLRIHWQKNGRVLMTGPATRSFTGAIDTLTKP
jgi:diaminopimelate epimerase